MVGWQELINTDIYRRLKFCSEQVPGSPAPESRAGLSPLYMFVVNIGSIIIYPLSLGCGLSPSQGDFLRADCDAQMCNYCISFPSVVLQSFFCLLNKDSHYHFCHLDDLVDPFSPTKDKTC